MRRAAKIVSGVVGGLVVLAAGASGFVLWKAAQPHDAPYPEIVASGDPHLIQRGRYLAYGPAHCVDCHSSASKAELAAGGDVPLTGGNPFVLPVGAWYAANLTPDAETGIGRYTDAQLARSLRHGVAADGRMLLPVMPFQNLSDEDMAALISFLRAQPAVRNEVPAAQPNFVGKAVLALVLSPEGPNGTPPAALKPAPTVEYGSYLANSVANCHGCHTKRDMVTGAWIGPAFAGGAEFPDPARGELLVSPNLTADPKTGIMADWSEEQFIERFRSGRAYEGSHMPWEAFGRMSDDDLRAIYRYLRSLPPVENDVGEIVRTL